MEISVYAIPGIIVVTPTDFIDKVVCKVFEINEEQLRSRCRKREIVEARQTAMYLYRKRTTLSFAETGYKLGRFDHATVVYACRVVKTLAQTDKRFAEKLNQVKKQLIEA